MPSRCTRPIVPAIVDTARPLPTPCRAAASVNAPATRSSASSQPISAELAAALRAGAQQREGEAVGVVDALGVARDLGADHAACSCSPPRRAPRRSARRSRRRRSPPPPARRWTGNHAGRPSRDLASGWDHPGSSWEIRLSRHARLGKAAGMVTGWSHPIRVPRSSAEGRCGIATGSGNAATRRLRRSLMDAPSTHAPDELAGQRVVMGDEGHVRRGDAPPDDLPIMIS